MWNEHFMNKSLVFLLHLHLKVRWARDITRMFFLLLPFSFSFYVSHQNNIDQCEHFVNVRKSVEISNDNLHLLRHFGFFLVLALNHKNYCQIELKNSLTMKKSIKWRLGNRLFNYWAKSLREKSFWEKFESFDKIFILCSLLWGVPILLTILRGIRISIYEFCCHTNSITFPINSFYVFFGIKPTQPAANRPQI